MTSSRVSCPVLWTPTLNLSITDYYVYFFLMPGHPSNMFYGRCSTFAVHLQYICSTVAEPKLNMIHVFWIRSLVVEGSDKSLVKFEKSVSYFSVGGMSAFETSREMDYRNVLLKWDCHVQEKLFLATDVLHINPVYNIWPRNCFFPVVCPKSAFPNPTWIRAQS